MAQGFRRLDADEVVRCRWPVIAEHPACGWNPQPVESVYKHVLRIAGEAVRPARETNLPVGRIDSHQPSGLHGRPYGAVRSLGQPSDVVAAQPVLSGPRPGPSWSVQTRQPQARPYPERSFPVPPDTPDQIGWQALVQVPGFPLASSEPPRHAGADEPDPDGPLAILQHRSGRFIAQAPLPIHDAPPRRSADCQTLVGWDHYGSVPPGRQRAPEPA